MHILNTNIIEISKITPKIIGELLLDDVNKKIRNSKSLRELKKSYPEFDKWYFETVIPDIKNGYNGRDMLVVIAKYKNGEFIRTSIAGISVLKCNETEKKICTFHIFPGFERYGIGTLLMKKCFSNLGTNKPLLTVSSRKKPYFDVFLKLFGFELTSKKENYYVKGDVEYIYNGDLK